MAITGSEWKTKACSKCCMKMYYFLPGISCLRCRTLLWSTSKLKSKLFIFSLFYFTRQNNSHGTTRFYCKNITLQRRSIFLPKHIFTKNIPCKFYTELPNEHCNRIIVEPWKSSYNDGSRISREGSGVRFSQTPCFRKPSHSKVTDGGKLFT